MRPKNKLIALFIFFVVIATAIFYFDRLAVYAISKIHHLRIRYNGLENKAFKELVFTDLEILDEKRGIGIACEYAQIKPEFKHVFTKDMAVDFRLSSVRFVRNEPEAIETYDTLSGLVSTPFASRWSYKEIRGRIGTVENGVHIEGFVATSDDIRTSLSGDIYYDNNLDLEIVIYFSNKLVTKIPDVLSKVVLKDERDEWKSLSVNLKGNYKAPSIEVSGRLFRLNIGAISNAE